MFRRFRSSSHPNPNPVGNGLLFLFIFAPCKEVYGDSLRCSEDTPVLNATSIQMTHLQGRSYVHNGRFKKTTAPVPEFEDTKREMALAHASSTTQRSKTFKPQHHRAKQSANSPPRSSASETIASSQKYHNVVASISPATQTPCLPPDP